MRQAMWTQHIARPPEVVWSFLSDLRNDKAWRREIASVEVVSGTPHESPTTYREILQWQGVDTEIELTVVDSVKGSRVVVVSSGPGYSTRSTWTFDPHPEGSLVTLVFMIETTGPMRLTEPFVWSAVTGWLERDLPLLEGHLAYA